MKTQVTVTIKPEQEGNNKLIEQLVAGQLKNQDKNFYDSFCRTKKKQFVIVKKSIDARHGQVKLHLRYEVYVDEEPPALETKLPVWKKADGTKTVVIVGSGPAGLFAALKLLEYGIVNIQILSQLRAVIVAIRHRCRLCRKSKRRNG